ncbi:hypothetical protein [Thauera phenylacetica]|uniref:FlgO domain-containing protein n=1 Tax=Thauera phenylacetica B4P TaxID=1234382 RepID=N6YVC0_9RHOO|nr:hypothetical protein [Thauera phenylacetica]ENO95490.1 hypothetical protein C667_18751 [Thauera phenylacetica B4P]MBP6799211.1 hypothetical protein [Luteimonas sp.]
MKKTLAAASAAALLAGGCALPVHQDSAANAPAAVSQSALHSAAHWNGLARDVAQRLSARLAPQTALFVNQHADASAFDRAFSTQLITALLEAGHPVLRTPAGALRVGVDTQVKPGVDATGALEVIVSTSVTDSSQFIARETGVFRADAADEALYLAAPQARSKSFQIVGGE